jgi:hypothetical protein
VLLPGRDRPGDAPSGPGPHPRLRSRTAHRRLRRRQGRPRRCRRVPDPEQLRRTVAARRAGWPDVVGVRNVLPFAGARRRGLFPPVFAAGGGRARRLGFGAERLCPARLPVGGPGCARGSASRHRARPLGAGPAPDDRDRRAGDRDASRPDPRSSVRDRLRLLPAAGRLSVPERLRAVNLRDAVARTARSPRSSPSNGRRNGLRRCRTSRPRPSAATASRPCPRPTAPRTGAALRPRSPGRG